jgi:hypothetical protein
MSYVGIQRWRGGVNCVYCLYTEDVTAQKVMRSGIMGLPPVETVLLEFGASFCLEITVFCDMM